ncbi:putative membrane protein [Pseudorhodoferax soli]|uniref:Putative membrane protein n=2 Tax=Pseudorhodoferax soli TaxID=545864 RepID=A0A368XQL3_9BURK|nr:putative membrane protein [Pseudorhodoferax soli]
MHPHMFEHLEHLVRLSVEWLRLLVEGLGAVAILLGLLATVQVLWRSRQDGPQGGFGKARVTFARYLTFALELQLAADVLSTAVSPNWDQIGKLAAIAVIRTALNHFLRLEMREEEQGGRSA